MSDDKKPTKLNIELPEQVAEGTYSNLAVISHSPSEFVIDFIRLMPNQPKAKVKSRIIVTPLHAKRLLKALADNVSRYENQFGTIAETNEPPMPPMSFNTHGQA
ncbi:MAG: DUF3467 domain-containing protein [Saprospiraceae bacterium]|nr:DUF3467 domain-containing protein [Saprospiraceae bacterium]